MPKDTNVEAAELNIQEKLTKQGLEGVSNIDKNFIYDSMSPTLTTKNAYLDFVYKSRGKGGRSIAQEIQSLDGEYTDVIFKVLNDRGLLQELDKGNDGLDRSDFDAKSYKAVADHILKGNNFDMSKSIALDIYSETVGQQALDRGFNAYTIKQEALNKEGNTIDTPFGSISRVRAKTYVDELISRTNVGDEIQDLRGNNWVFNKDGNWHAKDADVIRTRKQMFEKMSMQGYFPDEYQKVLGGKNIPIIEGGGKTDPPPAAQTFKDDPNYDTIYSLVGDNKINSGIGEDTGKDILSSFKSLYPDFTFIRPRRSKMEIRKNGKLLGIVDMNKSFKGGRNKSVQKVLELINSFNK